MKMLMKKGVTLFVGALAITAVAGLAQAETRFAVQDAAGTVDKMVVTDSGYVGVGTSLPSAALNIIGSTPQSSQIVNQFFGTTTANGGAGFIGYHNNAAGALPNANDRLGYFYFGAYDGTSPLNAAGISAKAEAAWTGAPTVYMPSYFAFETSATNTRTEKMRITGAGNVGIGTTVPTQKLQIVGGIKLDSAAKPTCASTVRGTIWYTYLGAGLADTLEVCSKDSAGNYAWRALF